MITALPDTFTLLPTFAFPLILKFVRVPTLVMFDCAAFTTVFAVEACVAFATVPVTLAPGIPNKFAALPLK